MSSNSETYSCNVTAYTEWHSSQFTEENILLSLNRLRKALLDIDRSDADAWKIMHFDYTRDDFIELYSGRRPKTLNISAGQAMELSTVWCKQAIEMVWLETAGAHGPPSNISIHDAMCDEYCLASDAMRLTAMQASHCDCLALSTQNTSLTFTREGDFCRAGSASMLCADSTHIMCRNTMNCELNDFSCPRANYDEIEVALGKCSSANELSMFLLLKYVALAVVYFASL